MALASKLSESFDVTVLVGDASPTSFDVPDSVDFVFLPTLGVDPDSNVFDIDRQQELRDRIIARRDVMLRVFERVRPRVLAIENFPFSLRRLRGEILPLVERARNGIYGDSMVACVIDGIVVDESLENERNSDAAAKLLDKYFDLVLVQSDPVFARLEEFFQPKNTLSIPLYHTGFVAPETASPPREADQRDEEILVSAGDGYHGDELFRTAVEAQKVLWPVSSRKMSIVAGPQLPSAQWHALQLAADGVPGLTLSRGVRDLRAEMARVRWSISQCGYNTAINAMSTQTPSLFVPCSTERSREQIVRAQRLVYWGAGRLLMPHHLNVASLANEINELMRFKPRLMNFDMGGVDNAASLITQIVNKDLYSPMLSRTTSKDTRPY